jgi:hypothetical protein
MKDMMNKLVNNPLGSAILIGTVTSGIVSIIRAVRGNGDSPLIKIDISKNKPE